MITRDMNKPTPFEQLDSLVHQFGDDIDRNALNRIEHELDKKDLRIIELEYRMSKAVAEKLRDEVGKRAYKAAGHRALVIREGAVYAIIGTLTEEE